MATAIKPIDEIRSSITRMDFKPALPAHITEEKFKRVAMTAITNNQDLLNADRTSLYSSCMKAAQDGLLPDGREAALVKFGDKVQYMPMVAGILKKARNSGELASIGAHIIYEADAFEFWIDDDGEHLKHEPNLFAAERGPILGVYAMAKTKDGDIYIEAMTKADIEKVRQSSRSKNGGPWSNWWEEMAKKTAIRRLAKRLPMSTDVEESLRHDTEIDITGEQQAAPVIDKQPVPRKSRLAQVAEANKQPENQSGTVIEGEVLPPDPVSQTAPDPVTEPDDDSPV